MKYTYQDYVFEHGGGKSKLYKNGLLLFHGNSWTGINMFISHTARAEPVLEMFRAQLEQREEIKLKAEAKKPKEPEPPVIEEPKKKPVVRRPGRDIGRIVR
jgi:hypothetical protein